MSGYAEYREVNLPWLKAVPAHWEIRRKYIHRAERDCWRKVSRLHTTLIDAQWYYSP